MDQPTLGDVFGEMIRDAYAVRTGIGPRPLAGGRVPRPVIEIIERDDGLINGAPADHYLAEPGEWQPHDVRALRLCRGAVLDVGCGAGRTALALQRRGMAVTGLDTSPGAIEVARLRGLRDTVTATVDDYARAPARYDTFLLLGNNLGLLEGPGRAPAFLAALAALARPGARIVAQGTDPYGTTDPVHAGYHRRNRERGRIGGQLRLRLRYRLLATDWFDYLNCSVDELEELLRGTAWRLKSVDTQDRPYYLAVMELHT
ncbi:class I SAM-dependent methyltransferase [Couchioplanes caeruleus]|uniref:Methyltransferase type 11 n=2 Tax=Couchioplanes caeruleus TaxID=56438 RepID=A0A1K0GE39_9ACTN|nr:methyltransferase domain-containing protein [Couchioplanes caeruleus]OJF15498.1 methyltransferase type 11 [Couchioplanes caeruleus subsp. caeruleus]ROP30971.1 methyltransferase family protein [Couchioplanes caeruleus]